MNVINDMNSLYVLLFLLLTVSVSGIFLISPAFAEEHTVRIPLSAASPSCANDDTCYVTSEVIINEGHKVEWINDDSNG